MLFRSVTTEESIRRESNRPAKLITSTTLLLLIQQHDENTEHQNERRYVEVITGCIDSVPVCCSVTSGSGGRLPAPGEPLCSPCWSHQRIDSPGRHVPCLTYWKGIVKKNKKKFKASHFE